MKSFITPVGLGVLGIAVGFALSRGLFLRESDTRPGAGAEVRQTRSADAKPVSAQKTVPEEKKLARLLALYRGGPEETTALRKEMERLGPEELQNRMADLIQMLGKEPGNYGLKETLKLFGEELFKRKGEGALEWAEGLDEKSRKLALGAILRFAAGESPALAKQWIDRLKEGYGADWAVSFASVAVKAAAARGTDDWLAISRLYGEALAEGPYTAPVYADDFDFAKMLAAFPKGHGAREALKYWTAKDKDAAWETVKALFGQKSEDATLSMGAMWGGVAASEGKERALTWLLARLDEIPQDMRADTVKNLMRQNEALPEDYGALIKAFPRQDDRLNFASGTIAVWGDVNEVHAVLGALPHQERVDVIVKAATGYSGFYQKVETGRAEEIAGYFDQRITEYSLSEAEKARVLHALGNR